MPSSFNHYPLRAGAPTFGTTPLRAHDKENSFAPALVSQEQEYAGSVGRRSGAGCRSRT
jgi:hypothetical protein